MSLSFISYCAYGKKQTLEDDLNEMSTRYLRQCESMTFAQNTIRKMYKQAGTEVTFNPVKCDYDGNYGPYTIENGM